MSDFKPNMQSGKVFISRLTKYSYMSSYGEQSYNRGFNQATAAMTCFKLN